MNTEFRGRSAATFATLIRVVLILGFGVVVSRADNITVSGNYSSSATVTSTGAITSSGYLNIPQGISVSFLAATQVSLQSGFCANDGCAFNAQSIGTSTRPADPTAWAAINKSSGAFTATWGSVANAIGYYFDLSTNEDFTSYLPGYQSRLIAASQCSCPVAGLSNVGTYFYRVRAQDSTGTSNYSNVIRVVVAEQIPPVLSITSQPESRSAILNRAAFFSVSVEGSPPFNYRWLKNGSPVVNGGRSILVIENVQPSDVGTYYVTVTNLTGTVTSQSVQLTLSAGVPTILMQPVSQTVPLGSQVAFSVLASGADPLNYQWRKDGTNIAGATSATLNLASASASDAGSYAVVVSNGVGSTLSSAASLAVNVPPVIAIQPQGQVVVQGASVVLSIAATGTAPLTYQWRKNGSNIAGATLSTYVFTSIGSEDAGVYTVAVSNIAGTVTSSSANLTVNTPPIVVGQPQSQMVGQGSSATLSVIASGTSPLGYQWRKNGANVSGAVSATLTLNNIQSGDLGTYDVVVKNVAGSMTSNGAVVGFAPIAPVIVFQPLDQSVIMGAAATFSVTATGLPAPAYQWLKNGNPINGANATSIALTNLQLADSATYSVRVSNSAGSVTSTAAVLTVNKNPQTIAFAAPANHKIGDAPFTLSATASSGLPVTFSVASGPATISGNVLTLGSIPGTIVVRAMQAGNGIFAAAPTVIQTMLLASADGSNSGNGGTLPINWPNVSGSDTHAVGTTSCSLQVDKSGALVTNVPLWVSPGTAGLQPALSLSYSSQGGAGIAGYGWSLSGFSSITRGKKTLVTDKEIHGVNFTYDDQYYLDGQRLILVSGMHGHDGAEYRTEIETFTRIIAKESAGNGPLWFKAWTKEGKILEFGGTSDSRLKANSVSHSNEVETWSVSKISDVSGNYMAFTYLNDYGSGEQRLSRIDYTGHEGTPATDTYASVRLDYEERLDARFIYIHGAKYSSSHRLKTVTAYYGETPVRTYALEYITRPDTNRSILNSVTESGSDGVAYNPLKFVYTDPPSGWDIITVGAWPPDANSPTIGGVDLDGDGRPDAFGPNGKAWLNRPSGWKQVNGYNGPSMAWGDINNDGLVDGIDFDGNVYLNTGVGLAPAPEWKLPEDPEDLSGLPGVSRQMPPGLAAYVKKYDAGNKLDRYQRQNAQLKDINNDGRLDIVVHGIVGVWVAHSGDYVNGGYSQELEQWPIIETWINTGSGWKYQDSNGVYNGYYDDSHVHIFDIDGDGVADRVQMDYELYSGNSEYHAAGLTMGVGKIDFDLWASRNPTSAEASSLLPPVPFEVVDIFGYSTYTTELVDLNGDGLLDLVRRNNFSDRSAPADYLGDSAWFNTGDGWAQAPVNYKSPFIFNLKNPRAPVVDFIDINNDGIVDLVMAYDDASTGESFRTVRLGTSNGWSDADSADYVMPFPMKEKQQGWFSISGHLMDFNGDGAIDVGYQNKIALNKRVNPDRLSKITNGFGIDTTITYAPLTERDSNDNLTVYSKDTSAGWSSGNSVANRISSLYVVKLIGYDNGCGGRYTVDYHYGPMRSDRIRGNLGFAWTTLHDSRDDLVVMTSYYQATDPDMWSLNGRVTDVTTVADNGRGNVLSRISYDWAYLKYNNGATYFPYEGNTQVWKYNPDGTSISYSQTWPSFFDACGNPRYVNNLTCPAENDEDHEIDTSTDTIYANIIDSNHWIIGQVEKQARTAYVVGASALTQTTSYKYFDNGYLEERIDEPVIDATTGVISDGPNTVHKSYGYDSFGNVQSASVSGMDKDSNGNWVVAMRSTAIYFDSVGRFVDHRLNALNHRDDYSYDECFGNMLSHKDPNGLTTRWTYDGFGVEKSETQFGYLQTTYRRAWAGQGAPGSAAFFVEKATDGGLPSITYYDAFGRATQEVTLDGEGEMIFVDTIYDANGRARAMSLPHRDGAPMLRVTTYDLLGRIKSVVAPDEQSASGFVSNTTVYSGSATEVADAKGHVTRTERNAVGWILKIVRNASAQVGSSDRSELIYERNSFGKVLKATVDGVVTEMAYDIYGRQASLAEPNAGGAEHKWSYEYNAFGEVVTTTDAMGQTTTNMYDALGRLVRRSEAEGQTSWSYDSVPHDGGAADRPVFWVGMPALVTSPGGYRESYGYDACGRRCKTIKVIDGTTYTSALSYDSYGRPLDLTYPGGLQTRNIYNSLGFVKEIRRVDAARNDLCWHADSYSESGMISGESYGNGVTSDRVYSTATGRLLGCGVGVGGSNEVQNLSYLYDVSGNVTRRVDAATGRDERFSFSDGSDGYDGLDRLRSFRASDGAAVTVTYSANGNITNKSDVGDYSYDYVPAHGSVALPHAVHSAGSSTFDYDLDGNMLSGGGRTVTWTSFGQVRHLANGHGHYADFYFGAEHGRVKQVSDGGMTIYFDGIWEKYVNSGVEEERNYIFAPTGMIAMISVGIASRDSVGHYFHKDAIGSITAITSESGSVERRFAFDPWGKRVDPQTQVTILSSTNGGVTRGFTGHEELDDLGLVHMNGRVYDPSLGRFLSADSQVEDESDPQDYNRYSYVRNRPLVLTDPTGFAPDGDGSDDMTIRVKEEHKDTDHSKKKEEDVKVLEKITVVEKKESPATSPKVILIDPGADISSPHSVTGAVSITGSLLNRDENAPKENNGRDGIKVTGDSKSTSKDKPSGKGPGEGWKYIGKFSLTKYHVAREGDFKLRKGEHMVSVPGLHRSFAPGFLDAVRMQGTGRTSDGRYIHLSSTGTEIRSHTYRFAWIDQPMTASGRTAAFGDTVAVDPKVIELRSTLYIEGLGVRHADDTGGDVNGNHIDLFEDVSAKEANAYGWKKDVDVYLKVGK